MTQMQSFPGTTAILGPTNTGKTYIAIERMLSYRTGIIGFPLRLLARENYDKVCRRVGSRNVALLTGEEKIVPETARYFLCTVESMPLDRPSEFLAIDEIQLCSDRERGFIFTDRLLRARGLRETIFLGAETIKPVLNKLIPDIRFETKPRFSKLRWDGVKKLTRIPRRSAVVAFSANDVYSIAESIRRGRGGTAVILGALSPRTRNAQVAMYQSGEVDYLVASDAIGMGLNMDIDHVFFSSLEKFDGNRFRRLDLQEIAQVAGRAGRHTRDGCFGTLPEVGELEPDVIQSIEQHIFQPVKRIWWRNAGLEFSSLRDFMASLDADAPSKLFIKTGDGEDHLALRRLAKQREIRRLAIGRGRIRLLWEVCQIPDYRKTFMDAHINLLSRIYGHLCGSSGRIPTDWVARQLDHFDRLDGDIDTLMTRIAHARTWTYIVHRADWVENPAHWRDRAGDIENKLSDALHSRLTERFVDRRRAMLVQSQRHGSPVLSLGEDNTVLANGEDIGQLKGLQFKPNRFITGELKRLALATARRGLREEISARVKKICSARDGDFRISSNGTIEWRGYDLANLSAGPTLLMPLIRIKDTELLTEKEGILVESRLSNWLRDYLGFVLKPLFMLDGLGLQGAARGIAFQLKEELGAMPRAGLREQIGALGPEEKKVFRNNGVRFGLNHVFIRSLQRARPLVLRSALWSAFNGRYDLPLLDPAAVTLQSSEDLSRDYCRKIGFFSSGSREIRVDILDKLGIQLLNLSRKGHGAIPSNLASTLGLSKEELGETIKGLGYEILVGSEGETILKKLQKQTIKKVGRRRKIRSRPRSNGSPFLVLEKLRAL